MVLFKLRTLNLKSTEAAVEWRNAALLQNRVKKREHDLSLLSRGWYV